LSAEEQLKALSLFIASRNGATDVDLSAYRAHTEGFSMETFSFDAHWTEPGGEVFDGRLIARVQPEAGLLEPYDLRPQVLAMRAVHGTVAVPELLWFEEGSEVLGAPFYVNRFVAGDVPVPSEGPSGELPIEDPLERESLARDFAGNLAALHRFDWQSAGLSELGGPAGVPEDGRDAARRAVANWRGYHERSRAGAAPMMARAFRELEARLPRESPLCLVHGDYRTGNFLRVGGRITAILDWEMTHLGDPMEDLAWACSRIWRGQTDMPGLLVERERLLHMYSEAGGLDIDEQRLAFYDLLAAVKMSAIMTTGLRAWADGRTDDVRMLMFRHQLAGMQVIMAESAGVVGALS